MSTPRLKSPNGDWQWVMNAPRREMRRRLICFACTIAAAALSVLAICISMESWVLANAVRADLDIVQQHHRRLTEENVNLIRRMNNLQKGRADDASGPAKP
jgi:cell division protein FtsB